MESQGSVVRGTAMAPRSAALGDVFFDMLKEMAKNRHGSCNLYSLLLTLDEVAKPLAPKNHVVVVKDKIEYQIEIQLDSSSSHIVSHALKRIFDEYGRVSADISVITKSVKIRMPLTS